MIHAQELRIGNCIKDANGKIRFVTDRIISDIASAPERHGYEAIELTAERLDKFGFKRFDFAMNMSDWGIAKTKDRFYVEKSGLNEPFIFGYHKSEGEYFTIQINYVHQLQNLYYAIVGEELEVHNLV